MTCERSGHDGAAIGGESVCTDRHVRWNSCPCGRELEAVHQRARTWWRLSANPVAECALSEPALQPIRQAQPDTSARVEPGCVFNHHSIRRRHLLPTLGRNECWQSALLPGTAGMGTRGRTQDPRATPKRLKSPPSSGVEPALPALPPDHRSNRSGSSLRPIRSRTRLTVWLTMSSTVTGR